MGHVQSGDNTARARSNAYRRSLLCRVWADRGGGKLAGSGSSSNIMICVKRHLCVWILPGQRVGTWCTASESHTSDLRAATVLTVTEADNAGRLGIDALHRMRKPSSDGDYARGGTTRP